MKIPFVDLKTNYRSHKKEIDQAIKDVISSASFILGPSVDDFETNFAKFIGSKHCVAVDSGFSALELGLRALGIKIGDEVITPVNSYIASSSSISFTGAKPVWVDVDANTFNINIKLLEEKITSKTRAIMPVHLCGQPADMDEVMLFAKKHKLYVIEDACQAHGAEYKGKKVGSLGDFAAFSFYPGKNLGAFGDGGALVTNNSQIYRVVREMRNYGQKEKYQHVSLALNRRLDSIQAAILNVKLQYLENDNAKRRMAALKYSKYLKDLPLILPKIAENRTHVFHLYIVQTEKRDKLLQYLKRKGIEAGIHYPIPIHMQTVYKDLKHKQGDFPISEEIADNIISLPIFPEITDAQLRYVANSIRNYFRKA